MWQTWDNADYSSISNAPVLYTKSKHNRIAYRDVVAAFDIETSPVPGRTDAALYHWQIAIEDQLIHGRDWPSLYKCFMRMSEAAKPQRLLILVHNLSYEFHFLRTILEFDPENVFAIRPRKIAKCTYDNLEFRCTYILTNLSLGAWTKRMRVPHAKLDSEEYDHTLVRYPWTALSDEELNYCANDVLGLIEAFRTQLILNGDTIATVPLTATGYVRRDVKKVMRSYSQRALARMQPTPEIYLALREAFRGGDTHCSRYYSGAILHEVVSYDRSSSYPDVLCNCEFPMGEFKRADPAEFDRLSRLHRALLFRVRMTNVHVRDDIGNPPLSLSKCRRVTNYYCDNGRIIAADMLETTLTEIDWIMMTDAYRFDFEILDLWETVKGYLPQILVQLVIHYYKKKTELKGVPGMELFYQKAKELLNSIFGLMAQDPVKQDLIYDPENPDLFRWGDEDIAGKLKKSTAHPYGTYAWGVYTTALARLRLWEMTRSAGDDFVYCDTDSIKSLTPPDGLDEYNTQRVRDSLYSGAYATDPQGGVHYMGVFEYETTYKRFRSWGAKKYAYEDEKGRLGITIAGVGKKKGREELNENGGLEAFVPGLKFQRAGGLEAVYNDRTNLDVVIDGHDLHIGPNIYLKPGEYTVGIDKDYRRLLEDVNTMRQILHDIHK